MINLLFKQVASLFQFYNKEDKEYRKNIKAILGRRPFYLTLYKIASLHSSVSSAAQNGARENNERLEFLGDAVLSLVVAEYLFHKYPLKKEGFLTDIRARIVNRETLNQIAKKIGIKDFVRFNKHGLKSTSHKSIYGNALEAFIGATYLDRGYLVAKKFIINKVIVGQLDLDELVKSNPNHKSRVIEKAQKEGVEVEFRIIDEKNINSTKQYTAQIFYDNEPLAIGYGLSKKKAEQDAASKSCELLNI